MAQADYFRLASLWVWVVGIIFDVFMTLLAFAPHLLPLSYLGFFQELVDNHSAGVINLWWFLAGVHIAEALVSFSVCTAKGVTDGRARFLWFLQTLLFGYFALGLLFKFNPDRQKQK